MAIAECSEKPVVDWHFSFLDSYRLQIRRYVLLSRDFPSNFSKFDIHSAFILTYLQLSAPAKQPAIAKERCLDREE